MSNKKDFKRLRELLKKIKEKVELSNDEELKEACKEAEGEVNTLDDDGSNPPTPPPGKKP